MAKVVGVAPPTKPAAPITEGEVTLTLTYTEAMVLITLVRAVGGTTEFRKHADKLSKVLGSAGIPSLTMDAYDGSVVPNAHADYMLHTKLHEAAVTR